MDYSETDSISEMFNTFHHHKNNHQGEQEGNCGVYTWWEYQQNHKNIPIVWWAGVGFYWYFEAFDI